jgi:hypothetical protein
MLGQQSDITLQRVYERLKKLEHQEAQSGEWIDIPYRASDFTASAGTWTVAPENVTVHAYAEIGKTMLYTLRVTGTTISAAPHALSVPIPNRRIAARGARVTFQAISTAGTGIIGLAVVAAHSQKIDFYATIDPFSAAWGGNPGIVEATLFFSIF